MHQLAGVALSAILVVTTALVGWGLVRIWTRLRATLVERPPSLVREPDALYRDGRLIARVEGATVDEAARSAHFDRLTGTVNLLNLGSDVVEFRGYRLRCVAIGSMTGSPPSPYLYAKVNCTIVGQA